MRPVVKWFVLTLIVLIISAGIFYAIVRSVMNGLQVSVSDLAINNPVLNGDLLNDQLTGTITVAINNPTPHTITVGGIYAQVVNSDGNVLATINQPAQVAVTAGQVTQAPVPFQVELAGALVSGVVGLMSKGMSVTVIGYVRYMGIFQIPINQQINLKM